MKQRSAWAWVLAGALSAAGLGAATQVSAGPGDGARAPNVSGLWHTTWDGQVADLTLQQTGNTISGGYVTTGAPPGSVSGTLTGNVLDGTWVDQQGSHGAFRFMYSEDFRSFVGTWGSGSSATNGGNWNGTR